MRRELLGSKSLLCTPRVKLTRLWRSPSAMAFSSRPIRMRWSSTVLGLTLSAASAAQPVLTADLRLRISPPLPALLVPGAAGTLLITVSNAGPDDAGATSLDPYPLVARTSLQMERPDGGINVRFLPMMQASDCILIATIIDPMPGGRPQWSFGLFFPSIPAGESVSCGVRYELDGEVAGQLIPITWRVRTFTETDPNPDNDAVALAFNVGSLGSPAPVAVPLLRPAVIWWFLLPTIWLVAAMRLRNFGGRHTRSTARR